MNKKNTFNLLFALILLHISITTLSNALVSIPLTLYNFKITWAAFSFPIIVVATDLTVRLLGKSIARKTITYTYPLAIISSILIVYAEGNPQSVAFRIGFASSTAYALGMLIDIYIFQIIREKYSTWWLAPALSTIVSNVIDSYTFFFAAFSGSDDPYMALNWFEIAGTQTILKIIIGLIFFLPAYGLLLNFLLKKITKK
ncbi:MAG: queuosine precursor transporter [Flavobacteriaceae bacterium]|nr:queuosine precursor transporter [Flavobacteriaceae bacterium]